MISTNGLRHRHNDQRQRWCLDRFVKGAKSEAYKYRITQSTGRILDKIDPCAFSAKLRPEHDSIICDLTFDQWDRRMDARKK